MLVDPKVLKAELIKSHREDKLTPLAVKLITEICKNTMLIKYNQFQCAEDREDALQRGLYDCIRKWRKCDLVKYSSPYPYFCEIFITSLIGYIKYESGYKYKNFNISISEIDDSLI
jgi:hypothetical protein